MILLPNILLETESCTVLAAQYCPYVRPSNFFLFLFQDYRNFTFLEAYRLKAKLLRRVPSEFLLKYGDGEVFVVALYKK
jgi:hypothetical protein